MNEGEESGRFTIKDRRGGWYDPKITLGNILTVLGMFVAIMLAWGQLDKQQEIQRVRLELYIQENEKDKAIKGSLDTLRRQVEDQNAKLEDIKRLCR